MIAPTIATVPKLEIDPKLKALLAERIAALTEDLIDYTEYVVVQAGDTEDDIIRLLGFSPLVEPIDGARFGTPLPAALGLAGGPRRLVRDDLHVRLYVRLRAADRGREGTDSELRRLCRP